MTETTDPKPSPLDVAYRAGFEEGCAFREDVIEMTLTEVTRAKRILAITLIALAIVTYLYLGKLE